MKLHQTARTGFTLIELLVVVLIIGILAAVALPKYQFAVDKSRAVQLVTAARAYQEALKRYQLANGDSPSSLEELDIQLPANKFKNLYFATDHIHLQLDKLDLYLAVYTGLIICQSKSSSGKKICQSIGKKETEYCNPSGDCRYNVAS